MRKVILIKYGELTTKKDNRNFFINKLKNNINEINKEMALSSLTTRLGRKTIEINNCISSNNMK